MTPVIETVHVTSDFKKAFKKLYKHLKAEAVTADQQFRLNPKHSKFNLRALKGPLEGYHAYSVNKDLFISLRFITPKEVIYYDIGTHSVFSPIQRKLGYE